MSPSGLANQRPIRAFSTNQCGWAWDRGGAILVWAVGLLPVISCWLVGLRGCVLQTEAATRLEYSPTRRCFHMPGGCPNR